MGGLGHTAAVWAGTACALAVLGCHDDGGPAPLPGASQGVTPLLLSEWHLFEDLRQLEPREGVVPYEMVSPLFTDYAIKHRFMYVPEGSQIQYDEVDAWQFPLGSILVKHFAYPRDPSDPSLGERPLETRLLVHTERGIEPEVYVWNEEGTDAERQVSGASIPLAHLSTDGETIAFDYGVPTRAECRKCHGTPEPIEGALSTRSLGPMTGQLNRLHDYGEGPINQVDHLASLGWLDQEPSPAQTRVTFAAPEDAAAPLVDRARAYLSSNCGHCHSPKGEVFDKQLWLDWEHTAKDSDPYYWGVCKRPTSAGNAECEEEIDIVPGHPEQSLLICRMRLVGKGQMAPLGRNLAHAEGIEWVSAWIAGMNLPPCKAE